MRILGKMMVVGFVVATIFASATQADAKFLFPGMGKIALYAINGVGDREWRFLMYRDHDDQFVQMVVWYAGPCNDTRTMCVFRGWGEFLPDGSMLSHLFYRGNSIAPDETAPVNTFRVFPDGTVVSSGGTRFSMDLLFVGTSPQDGVYFTQQWGCTPPPGENGQPCKMRLLDEQIGPWHSSWDMQAFVITDDDDDMYFALPAVGPGMVGMEWGWARHSDDGDGVHRRGDPRCPSWIFGDGTPGCAGVDVVLPYGGGWWLKSRPEDLGILPVTFINGRSVRATSRDPRVLEEYKKRGPVCYDPTLPGCFPE